MKYFCFALGFTIMLIFVGIPVIVLYVYKLVLSRHLHSRTSIRMDDSRHSVDASRSSSKMVAESYERKVIEAESHR